LGPGIAVRSSIARVIATRLTIPQRAVRLHMCIALMQAV
jgi:hypothetical protein